MDVSLLAGRFYRQKVVVGKTVQPGSASPAAAIWENLTAKRRLQNAVAS
jgi:hypothetical protein